MSLLEVTELTHGYGDKVLYKNAAFDLCKGEHMGVVGQNGAGKSTLVGILIGETIPDQGNIKWQPDVKLGYLDQYAVVDQNCQIINYLQIAFQDLYKLEQQISTLYSQYADSGEERLLKQVANAQTRLETSNFYNIDIKIEKVVMGLGLDAIGVTKLLSELSGGQRAKVILAKLLLEEPDILLLDEPTNFLDKEHVDWLVEFLTGFPNAFIVVSHDFTFLERTSNCICDIEAETIMKYHGKYSDFLKQKKHLREDHIRRYQAQQQMIKRTEDFIRKNIAGNNSKNAKGRRKQLERVERIAAPTFTSKPIIHFEEIPLSAQKVLTVTELEVGYQFALLPKLNFTVRGGEKIVITGFNGIGKSTLLKTLTGQISEIAGSFDYSPTVKIGYFEQELYWDNKNFTPIQVMSEAYPNMTEKQIRKHLANCGVKKDSVLQAVSTLSGGEQSKVKLCRLIVKPYNFLILDEPTNHLDVDTKKELQNAMVHFNGSIILVSHEEAFYKNWADRVFGIDSIVKQGGR